MALQEIHAHQLPNGLTVLIEPMRSVQSASFSLIVPAGVVHEEASRNGTSAVLCDLMVRGAGDRDSRRLSEDLDSLGLQRSESVGWNHISFSGASVAENLLSALEIYADIVRRPHLPKSQFSAVVTGLEQSLRSIEDEPRQKVIIELRRRCYDDPWGRPTDGDLEEIHNVRLEDVQALYQRSVQPQEAILGIAGNVNASEVMSAVEQAFGGWEAKEPTLPRGRGRLQLQQHIALDSTQTHIGLAFPGVPYRKESYYAAWAAVNVLSGGSSSRLFTEVRERRGLCYSVYATLHSLRDQGMVLAYAGTTSERAQETLDVTLSEILRLGEGIEAGELDRCKAGAKSALIMQQESTGARAASIARDWFHLGRVTTLDEVHDRIDALTVDSVVEYVRAHPPENLTVLTIGPEPLKAPAASLPLS
jgi:predicted Zn-dependent peptidase